MIKTTGGTNNNYIVRNGYGTFPINTKDWTLFFRFKYPTTPASAHYANLITLFAGTIDFNDPYVFIGSRPANEEIVVEVFDGVSDIISTAFTASDNTQYWGAITYEASTSTTTLIIDGSVIGTVVLSLSDMVFTAITILGDGGSGNTAAISGAYFRCWQSLLSMGSLISEAASITPTITTTLLFTNPTQTSVDLTDHLLSDQNQFSAVGTVTTDLDDPLLNT